MDGFPIPSVEKPERMLIKREMEAGNPGLRAAIRYGNNVRNTTIRALEVFNLKTLAKRLNRGWSIMLSMTEREALRKQEKYALALVN